MAESSELWTIGLWDMKEAFDPYWKWLGIPPEEQPPNHYRLLGLTTFEAHPDVIANAVESRMAHVKKFQTSRYAEHSQEVLNHLAAAKVCLLNDQRRAEYDRSLAAQLEAQRHVAAAVLPRAIPVASVDAVPHAIRLAPEGSLPKAIPVSPEETGPKAVPMGHEAESSSPPPPVGPVIDTSDRPAPRRSAAAHARRRRQQWWLVNICLLVLLAVASAALAMVLLRPG